VIDRHRPDQAGFAVAAREQDEELAHVVGGAGNLALERLETEPYGSGEVEKAAMPGFEAQRAFIL
jgi:hypothetical protein